MEKKASPESRNSDVQKKPNSRKNHTTGKNIKEQH